MEGFDEAEWEGPGLFETEREVQGKRKRLKKVTKRRRTSRMIFELSLVISRWKC